MSSVKEVVKDKISDDREKISNIKEMNSKETKSVYQREAKNEKVVDMLSEMTISQKEAIKKELGRKKARESFLEYYKYCYPDFFTTPFHKLLCNLFDTLVKRVEKANSPNATEEDIRKGRIRILLSVPPRSGKSETITKTLPSWYIGRNPKETAILTAYNAELAEKFNNANRTKMKTFGKEVFGVEVSESQDNKGLFETTSGGGIMGVGIQGGITGNGGSLIIVDDPYKNSADANSPGIRKLIEDTFRDSVLTRLQRKGNMLVVIQTRWHEEDLCGVLQKEDGWYVINIPCVCENEKNDPLHRKLGETLCPELGFDTLWANATRKSVGEKVWNALYQGHPSIEGGEVFKREHIHYYTKNSIPNEFQEVVMSCDLSFGGTKQSNDPCAIQIWGRVGANHYLLKRIKKRMNFGEMCDLIKLLSATYPQARKKLVEKKANGQAVIDQLNGIIGGFVAYDPKMESKLSRANASTPYFESGNVFFPDKSIDSTIEEMVEEMMKFPNSAHDDEVDAMTQYLCTYKTNQDGRICVNSYYSKINQALRGLKL